MTLDAGVAQLLGFPAREAQGTMVIPAVVTKSDASGVWATPIAGDARQPRGPCRGFTRRPQIVAGDLTHAHSTVTLGAGTRVLLADTSDGPWIIAYDEEGRP